LLIVNIITNGCNRPANYVTLHYVTFIQQMG